jgi:hypothetical protein
VRKKTLKTSLPLLGGLGNQLFQLSAALYNNPGGDIHLISDLGHQRRNRNGNPDIESFSLPKRVTLSKTRASHTVCTKAFNLLLKSGIQTTGNLFTTGIARIISKVVLCVHTRKILRFHISEGVGFSEWDPNEENQMAIGYFQSHVWTSTEKVREELSKMKIIAPSPNFLELEKHLSSNSFIAIHVRLTDYEREPVIGTLDSMYFHRALKNFSDYDRLEIWLFSDDPEKALEMLPSEVKLKCNTFTKSGISANEEWQLMRYASEFYISNSTYSWWAARLAINPLAKVFVPKPWFAVDPQPNKLIPPEWVEVGRFE